MRDAPVLMTALLRYKNDGFVPKLIDWVALSYCVMISHEQFCNKKVVFFFNGQSAVLGHVPLCP